MKTLNKWLGLGIANPLILGMGHPVKVRLGRLMQPQRIRGGAMVTSLLVASGLAVTGFADSKFPFVKVTVPATVEFYKITNDNINSVPEDVLEIRFFTDQHVELLVGTLTFQKNKDGEDELFSGEVMFFASGKCVTHAKTSALPMSYPVQARVKYEDAPDTLYLVYCTPNTGTDVTREDIQAGNRVFTERQESTKYAFMLDAVNDLKMSQAQTAE